MNLKIRNIRALRAEDQFVGFVLLHKIDNGANDQLHLLHMSTSGDICAIEAKRIQDLNKNIEQAKAALDNYTSQNQSILYKLRSFFRNTAK